MSSQISNSPPTATAGFVLLGMWLLFGFLHGCYCYGHHDWDDRTKWQKRILVVLHTACGPFALIKWIPY